MSMARGEHLAVVTAVFEGQSLYVCVAERYTATLMNSLTTSEKPSETRITFD